jgi:hypothetical protein
VRRLRNVSRDSPSRESITELAPISATHDEPSADKRSLIQRQPESAKHERAERLNAQRADEQQRRQSSVRLASRTSRNTGSSGKPKRVKRSAERA